MLDEDEFERIAALMREGMNRRAAGVGDPYTHVLEEYRRITGFDETNHLALHHHRIALYGPPCHACGKPLRTLQAQRCGACGVRRVEA